MTRHSLIAWAALLAACAAEPSDQPDATAPAWHDLIAGDQWRAGAPDLDPFADHRIAGAECAPIGWYPEGDTLEIDTGLCPYLSITQPLQQDLAPGDRVRLQAWWNNLASERPAMGHIAVAIGDAVLWEEHIPIPGAADTRRIERPCPVGAPRGTPVTLHLHNHGYNTWTFAELAVYR